MNLALSCLRLFAALTVLTGVLYPLAVTGLAQLFFHRQAEGSLITVDGKPVGSELLAQKTENPRYFWPRPSAGDYATVASGASNLGPSSDALKKAIADRAARLRAACPPAADVLLPDDLLTASGSGLDPDISPAAARLQIDRVARARGFSGDRRQRLDDLVEAHMAGPQLGVLGEPRINVLLLNLAVDQLQ